MKVCHFDQVERKPVHMPDTVGCHVRWLVDETDGAPNFAMRQFDVAPGGYTPRHSHPYEHEVYVLEGTGEVYEGCCCEVVNGGFRCLITGIVSDECCCIPLE